MQLTVAEPLKDICHNYMLAITLQPNLTSTDVDSAEISLIAFITVYLSHL